MTTTKQAGVDWPSVAKMLAGGALLGGGAGAAVTFLNHLKELQAAAKPPSDDDVMYLDLPAKQPKAPPMTRGYKRASDDTNTAPTFALSSLAGLVGSALAYNTVRDVYNRRRKRELEKSLDEAQHVHLGNLTQKAASQYSIPTKVIGTGYLGLLLTALGSAVVANKMLQKRFPEVKSPELGKPKRILIRTVDPKTNKPVQESPVEEVSPDATEGVLRTQLADTKMAAHNELVSVVCAVAAGRGEELKNLIKAAGVEGMMAAVKGAELVKTSSVNRNLAATWLCHDPLMKAALSPMIAAEFFKSASWTFDLLPKLEEFGLKEAHLIGLVEASTQAVRANTLEPVLTKMASVKQAEGVELSPLKTLFFAGALKTIMDDVPEKEGIKEHELADDTASSDQSSTAVDTGRKHRHGVDMYVSGDEAKQWVQRHAPELDQTLARQS